VKGYPPPIAHSRGNPPTSSPIPPNSATPVSSYPRPSALIGGRQSRHLAISESNHKEHAIHFYPSPKTNKSPPPREETNPPSWHAKIRQAACTALLGVLCGPLRETDDHGPARDLRREAAEPPGRLRGHSKRSARDAQKGKRTSRPSAGVPARLPVRRQD